MGQIWSRVRKKPSTREVLEDLEKSIEKLEEYRQTTVQQQKRILGSLIFYSVILYIAAVVLAFFYWNPTDVRGQALCIIPLVIFPVLIWLLRRFCHWYFRRKLESNADSLTALLRKRRTTLNEVKEKETYKNAKEILEKYDPEYKKKKREEEEAAAAAAAQKAMGTPGTELRRRPVSAARGRGSFRGQGRGSPPPPSSSSLVPSQLPVFTSSFPMNGQQWPRPPGPPLPRQIPPREQKMMDRFVDFLIGDGPSNRYALICQRCLSHNGMALREEFEYLAFRCCYCYSLNPARKVRPFAPRLPSTPVPAIALQPQNDDSQDSVTESDSESTKKDDQKRAKPPANEQTVEISEIKEESDAEAELSSSSTIADAPETTEETSVISEAECMEK